MIGPRIWKDGPVSKREAKYLDWPDSVLRMRVCLAGSEPEIWRLLDVLGSMPLGLVHEVLQVAFGWEDSHLHRFTDSDPFAPLRPVKGEIPEALQWLPAQWCEEATDLDEDGCAMEQLLARGSGSAFYEYDFGDSWLHQIELVSRRRADRDEPPAQLIDGARRGPFEDCGGCPGYEAIVDALADPTHPGHAEFSSWVVEMMGSQDPFDPEFLDIVDTNRNIAGRLEALTATPDREPGRDSASFF